MRGAGSQLSQGDEFFGLHDLRLEPLKICDGAFGLREQASAVGIGQIGSQEDEQSQGNGSEENGHQPEIADRRVFMSEIEAYRWQRIGNDITAAIARRAGTTLSPRELSDSASNRVVRRRVKSITFLVSDDTREGKPKKGGNQGKIVQAAGVVAVEFEGDVDGEGGEHVHRGGAKEVGIDQSPCSRRAQATGSRSR